MKKNHLAVAVKDQEYLKRLAEYVRDSPLSEQWQVTAFTNADALRQYVRQGYSIDVLAAQPELLNELKSVDGTLGHGIPTVALVLKLGDSSEEHELHQFQPLPLLLQRLTEAHARRSSSGSQLDAAGQGKGGVKIIAVYSASGGTGKTALALHLAHAASSHHYRTFYLNLERWNTSDIWLGPPGSMNGDGGQGVREEGQGLSELLYEWKVQQGHASEWLLEHSKRHPLLKADYLAACTNVEDRLTLGAEDALGIMELISRSGQYDLIIVDLDDGLDELHTTVLERADQVLWVINDHASVHGKQQLAIRYGKQKWGERFRGVLRKTVFVRNRASAGAAIRFSEIGNMPVSPFSLPEAAEWNGGANATLLSSPTFRAAADKLLKHILRGGGDRAADRA